MLMAMGRGDNTGGGGRGCIQSCAVTHPTLWASPSEQPCDSRVFLSPFEERLLLLTAAIFKVMIPCLLETLFPLANS